MKVTIDRDGCISCGLCVSLCPDVFRIAEDGKAEVYGGSEGFELAVKQAVDGCPVSVIFAE